MGRGVFAFHHYLGLFGRFPDLIIVLCKEKSDLVASVLSIHPSTAATQLAMAPACIAIRSCCAVALARRLKSINRAYPHS